MSEELLTTEEEAAPDLIEAIRAQRDQRGAQLCNADPTWSRLQGMLDFAEGRIGVEPKPVA